MPSKRLFPTFKASTDDLEQCMVECGSRHKHMYQRAILLVEATWGGASTLVEDPL